MRHDLAMGCLALSLAWGGAVVSLGGCSERKAVEDAKRSAPLASTPASTPAPPAMQPGSQVVRIGWLGHGTGGDAAHAVDQLRRGLTDLGYAPAQFTIDVRYADGQVGRLRALADDLVRAPVDIIVTAGEPAALAAKAATQPSQSIPVVFTEIGMDPVKAGIVGSLARPEGNVTGLATMTDELWAKRFEMLTAMKLKPEWLVIVRNPLNPGNAECVDAIRRASQVPEAQVRLVDATDVPGLAQSLAASGPERLDAVAICWDAVTLAGAKAIGEFSASRKVPSLAPLTEYVVQGALLSLGLDLDSHRRRAASYVDRLVHGRKASELPVERTSNPMYAYNATTAKLIGATVPDVIALVAVRVPQE